MFPTIYNPNLNFSECETCPEIPVMGPSGWFVTLISTFQNAKLARKYRLWARAVDVMPVNLMLAWAMTLSSLIRYQSIKLNHDHYNNTIISIPFKISSEVQYDDKVLVSH